VTVRILHVVASVQGRGAETFAADLIRELAGRGVAQRVVALRSPIVRDGSFSCDVTYPDGRGLRLPVVGVQTDGIGVLRKVVSRWRPHVIQAHGGESLKYLAAARLTDSAALVYRRIGMAPPWLGSPVRRRLHAALMRTPARVVAVAEAVRREAIERFGLLPTTVVTIPNAVAVERIRPRRPRWEVRRSLGIPPTSICVLSLGALTWEKDPRAHLHVTAAAIRAGADVHHVFVGDGPLREEVALARETLGVRDRVHVLGHRSDVGDFLYASDCLLFASREGGMEGMPASVIEAGLAGLPVVGYSIAGVPEVVVHGTTGLLVPPGDVAGLGRALETLIRDEGLRRQLGAAARERCRSLFDIRVVAPRYLELYRALTS